MNLTIMAAGIAFLVLTHVIVHCLEHSVMRWLGWF